MKNRFLIFLVITSLGFSQGSVSTLFAADKSLRNVSQVERKHYDWLRSGTTSLLYFPRTLTDASLLGVSRTASYLSDPDFIQKVKDILYIYEEKLAWFPYASFTSGFRPQAGGGFYYHDKQTKALILGAIANENHWKTKFKISHREYMGTMGLRLKLEGHLSSRDDRRFYGIGADPHNNNRNVFQTDDEYGVFTEAQRKLQWSAQFEPNDDLNLRYLGYYQRSSFKSKGRGNKDLRNVFNLSSIPGFNDESPITELYNEAAFVIDTRDNKRMISPGARAEVYTGFSLGLGENDSDLIRAGFDVAGFIPLIREDRILIPRLVADFVEEADGGTIPFTEYARQNTFRGISSRALIRNDQVSLVPSVEYTWPLSHMLSGHVFADFLVVGRSLSHIEWNNALWAAGAGLDFHWVDREFGRIEIAGGSAGVQLTFSIGIPLETNDRGDWV